MPARPLKLVERWHGSGIQLVAYLRHAVDSIIPPELLASSEMTRRARLMVNFAAIGTLFGCTYALFYLLIGHWWGAEIALGCTAGVFFSPFLMRWTKSVRVAANYFSFILATGFLGLSAVEGGVHGHAVAWLVSVPLCALILDGVGPGIKWVVISFFCAAIIVGFDLAGIRLPVTYDVRWTAWITAAGYLGLISFMFLLGLTFEVGRARALARMQEALAELASTNQRLVEVNREKDEFLGIAAHDLRNPLTVILLQGEMLKTSLDSPSAAKQAEVIISAAERMRHLISNLLDVYSIERRQLESKPEPIDLAAIVNACVTDNTSAAERKGIRIETTMASRVSICADRVATAQILDNLVSNAVKYTPWSSQVEVQLRAEGNSAVVSVRDQGPGISAQDQQRLFRRFGRLSALPTGGEPSIGLGLAIAKELAEKIGGSIACESTLGQGATFLLKLPLAPSEALPAGDAMLAMSPVTSALQSVAHG